MQLKGLKYLLAYITPSIIILSLLSENNWVYAALIFNFGIIPFVELFTNGTEKNLAQVEEEVAKEDKLYDWLIYLLVPIQYFIIILFLVQVSKDELSTSYKIGAIIAAGIACGVLGINVAHELGHRSKKSEQTMAKILLLSSLYMHFFIEHNRGHHANVATDEDPASSRYGENLYSFFARSIWGSYWSAWALERKRLNNKGFLFWSLRNEMIWYHIIQISLVVLFAIAFGIIAALYFVAAAIIGILLLETVNYIEHYGLKRTKNGDRYERTMPIHSWNSNHPVGRLVLFELSRHSDHHYLASRKYQVLRHHENSPQMPTGYPGMMLLSLIPPLFFKVMHDRINSRP